uniref:Uncharacterized protein n=1 Tax=Romanomermis culicivorax TaxID=13658 RepID=A0A915JBF7_ROMCU
MYGTARIQNYPTIMLDEILMEIKIFLPTPLAPLPKTFGIIEICKGYFPHFSNMCEHYGCIGSYPSPDM